MHENHDWKRVAQLLTVELTAAQQMIGAGNDYGARGALLDAAGRSITPAGGALQTNRAFEAKARALRTAAAVAGLSVDAGHSQNASDALEQALAAHGVELDAHDSLFGSR